MVEKILINDIDYINLIKQGFVIGVITSASTLIIAKALNYGIQLLKKS